jgi:hypothetical protein
MALPLLAADLTFARVNGGGGLTHPPIAERPTDAKALP